MHRFDLWSRGDAPLTILCLGAHSDDIEIGCGGTVLRLLSERRNVRCHWIVLSRGGCAAREREARDSARAFLGAAATSVEVADFRDAYFPFQGAELKDFFENVKQRVQPDIIWTPHREDLHQDHRLVAELTWNTFRDHLILEYEIPKYDGGLMGPQVFVPLEGDHVERKVSLLMEHFATQRPRAWFTPDTFRGLMRIRGLECNAPSGYAEAFHAAKVVV